MYRETTPTDYIPAGSSIKGKDQSTIQKSQYITANNKIQTFILRFIETASSEEFDETRSDRLSLELNPFHGLLSNDEDISIKSLSEKINSLISNETIKLHLKRKLSTNDEQFDRWSAKVNRTINELSNIYSLIESDGLNLVRIQKN